MPYSRLAWRRNVFQNSKGGVIMRHLGTFFVVLAVAFDHAVTAFGQPAGYWTGTTDPDEGNPISALVLGADPFLAVLVGIGYLFFVAMLMLKMSHPYKLVVGSIIFTGHTLGALTWLSDWEV